MFYIYRNNIIKTGEVDACRAILDVWSNKNDISNPIPIVNATDTSQTTSLHKACANGHYTTVQLLLGRNALHLRNDSGNTPLHWASGAGHANVVRLLLDHYDALYFQQQEQQQKNTSATIDDSNQVERLDVLQKNNFGRSSLTEGFTSKDTKTVEHLLNHDSAEEDKLIGGLDKKELQDEDDVVETNNVITGEKKKEEKKGIVHEFDFKRGNIDEDIESDDDKERPSVLIRELVSIVVCVLSPKCYHTIHCYLSLFFCLQSKQTTKYSQYLMLTIHLVKLPLRIRQVWVYGVPPLSCHDG